MADPLPGPLARLVRLTGGVLLLQGRLGHQILGQMLILDASQLEVAGAIAVLAATAGQRNVVAQVTLRTVAPVLAARSLIRKNEQRLLRATRLGLARERAARNAAAARAADDVAAATAAELVRRKELEIDNERLRRRLAELTAGIRGGATSDLGPG